MVKRPTLQLKFKIPLIIVGFSLMVGAALQIAIYMTYRERTLAGIESEFLAVTTSRRDDLHEWIETISKKLLVEAASPATASAIREIGAAYRAIPGNPTNVLQAAYISENPHPVRERHNLMRAAGDEAYHDRHDAYHPFFLELQQQFSLYDVFLFDNQGNLIYSVFKESDFAQNFDSGPYTNSGLGAALKAMRELRKGETRMIDLAPYAPSNGAPAGFIITPVIARDGAALGAIAFQLPLDAILTRFKFELGLGETGEAFLIGEDFKMRTPSRFEGRFSELDPAKPSEHLAALFAGTEGYFTDTSLQSGARGFAHVMMLEGPGIMWGLVVERDAKEVLAPVRGFLLKTLTILAVAAAMVLALGAIVARSITKPIMRLSDTVQAIASGNLSVPVVDAARQDELGQIGQSLEGLREKLLLGETLKAEREEQEAEQSRVVRALSGGLRNLATGDLTQALDEPFASEYEALRDNFNKTQQTLNETITKVIEVSESIRTRSTEINRASEDLSHRTENQAAALEETAAALDELTGSVRSAAEGAKKVEGIVTQARREAEESGTVVQGAVAAMTEIEKSSDQISQIIGVIDDIAFQTNLLALNAGVEAARAGDAGKGFAVVASEVRALAQRSSAAAKEIKMLISTSTQHVGRGVDQVGRAGEALRVIVDRVAHIATLVSEIASGAGEQSTGLAEINIGVTQLDQVTQQNAAMVEEATAASQSLHHEATSLAEMVAKFTTLANVARGASAPGSLNARQDGAAFPARPWDSVARMAGGTKGVGVWQEF